MRSAFMRIYGNYSFQVLVIISIGGLGKEFVKTFFFSPSPRNPLRSKTVSKENRERQSLSDTNTTEPHDRLVNASINLPVMSLHLL